LTYFLLVIKCITDLKTVKTEKLEDKWENS
jgi:hypothetical protein